MGALDLLVDQMPVRLIREVSRSQQEQKAAQAMGSDSVLLDRVSSENDWDFVLPFPTYMTRELLVEYEPEPNDFGGGIVYKMFAKTADSGGIRTSYTDTFIERQREMNGKQRWIISITDFEEVRVKLYFSAIGTGNFSVSILS